MHESYSLTVNSSNVKTGKIAVSTSSAITCPDSCSFKLKGCYASAGPMQIHWRAVTEGRRGTPWQGFIDQVSALPIGHKFRHNQAGDLMGVNQDIDAGKLAELAGVVQSRQLQAWTYTHKPLTSKNVTAIKAAIKKGFVINASADSLNDADTKAQTGLPVCVVIPQDSADKLVTPNGRKVIVCPAQTRNNVSCASCMLCHKGNRSVIIGFKAHGTYRKAVSAIVSAPTSISLKDKLKKLKRDMIARVP